MIKAEMGTQLMIRVTNKIGSLAEVTSSIASSAINQIALCAYEVNNQVCLMFVTEDNNHSRHLLEKAGFQVQEEEVILLTIDNKPGSLQKITDMIAQVGIDLNLMYGSAEQKADQSRIVLISSNNLDVLMLIKTEMERS